MAYYTVYWPQDWLDELRKSNDTGPIKVVFGSHPLKDAINSINKRGRCRISGLIA